MIVPARNIKKLVYFFFLISDLNKDKTKYIDIPCMMMRRVIESYRDDVDKLCRKTDGSTKGISRRQN